MSITRRQFIRRSGLLTGGFLGAGLARNPLIQRALADVIGDRYFVVVFLDGGNDGLNTITPAANGSIGTLRDAYQDARNTGSGGLRLSGSDLLQPSTVPMVDANTGTPLGFHKGLAGLHDLYEAGKVAVIQGCGYPNQSLSHETSRHIWQRADPLRSGVLDGWVGRYLAANYDSADIPGVSIGGSVAGEFRTSGTSVLSISRLDRFSFPFGADGSEEDDRKAALLGLCNDAASSGQAAFGHVGANERATILAGDSYPPLDGLYESDRSSFDTQYGDLQTSTARDLREVAKVIYGVSQGVSGVDARFFEVRNGGYDTHSDQGAGSTGGRHYQLHSEVGDAIRVFYEDCADMGVADKLVVMVWSEFSRRIEQNDTGTDHGSQGPMFVVGGGVQGGLYGNHPDIHAGSLDDGNTIYNLSGDASTPYRATDFRDVYGTLLKHWLNLPVPQIQALLPADTGPDPAFYWTNPNFDLGFI